MKEGRERWREEKYSIYIYLIIEIKHIDVKSEATKVYNKGRIECLTETIN